MEKLTDPKVMGALRHLLSSVGPVVGVMASLVASGAITWGQALAALGTSWEAIVGLVMAALAFWASWTAKEKR